MSFWERHLPWTLLKILQVLPQGDGAIEVALRGRQDDLTAECHLLRGFQRRQPLLNLLLVVGTEAHSRSCSRHD